MADRILLGNSGAYSGLKISRPGYDVATLSSTDYDKLIFDSSWSAIERIHQAGSFRSANTGSSGPYQMKLVFSELGYLPMVTVRRKSALSGGTIYGDEWWTQSSGGADPYRNIFCVFCYSDHFWISLEPVPVTDEIASFITGPWFFDYIVWKIPIVPGQVYN